MEEGAEKGHDLLSIIESLCHGPVYEQCEVKLLIDGPATYDAMLEAIEGARERIDLETFMFTDGEVGQMFADAFARKRADGVRVRVIYDSFGSHESDSAIFEQMEADGIEVHEYHSLNPLEDDPSAELNVRDHRKLLVIDDDVAFTGGINIDDRYRNPAWEKRLNNVLEDGWRDTHVRITGPAVEAFRKIFESNWSRESGEDAPLDLCFRSTECDGGERVATLKSEGGEDQSPIARAYLQAFESARERIWVTQAYFVPDKAFIDALGTAAGRGVDVRVLVPGKSDSSLVLHASHGQYASLLERGVRIYESHQAFVHAKTVVIDGCWSSVGSSNLDNRSFLHNDELNAVIFGERFARQMEAQFRDDLSNCDEIDPESWPNRPVTHKVLEKFARLLSYWI